MRHAFAEEQSGIVLKNHGAALTRFSHGTVVAPTPAPERRPTLTTRYRTSLLHLAVLCLLWRDRWEAPALGMALGACVDVA